MNCRAKVSDPVVSRVHRIGFPVENWRTNPDDKWRGEGTHGETAEVFLRMHMLRRFGRSAGIFGREQMSRSRFCPDRVSMIKGCVLRLSLLGFLVFFLTTTSGAKGIAESGLPFTREITVDAGSNVSYYPVQEPGDLQPFSNSHKPKALIVHADPKSDSITAAARDSIARYLDMEGWEVEVHSLYEEAFNPVASVDEVSFYGPAPAQIDPDVLMYQNLIRQADALVLVYPLWWKQPPAMFKGWQDRVFTYGFAYEFVRKSPDSIVSLLTGKKVLFINIVAEDEDIYSNQGYLRYLNLADQSLYGASGMEIVDRHIIPMSTDMDIDAKNTCLNELASLVSLIEPSSWR